jgi:hypothetical protein
MRQKAQRGSQAAPLTLLTQASARVSKNLSGSAQLPTTRTISSTLLE